MAAKPDIRLPAGFSLDNIGKPVKVQIFDRSRTDPSDIRPQSMMQYVGVLAFYKFGPDGILVFTFERSPEFWQADLSSKYVEVYT